MKKRFSIILIIMLFLMSSALSEGAKLRIKKPKLESEIYTRLVVEGLDEKVYAFVNEKGNTQFRIYGSIDDKEGYFPIELQLNSNGRISIFFKEDLEPLSSADEKPGRAKAYEGKDWPVPNGFKKGNVNGYVEMRNFFGFMEYCIYASYDGKSYAYYPTKSSKAKLGALPIVIEDMQARLAVEGKFSYVLPSALENGFSTGVYLTLSDGSIVKARTDFPELVEDSLERHEPTKSTRKESPSPEPETDETPVPNETPANSKAPASTEKP